MKKVKIRYLLWVFLAILTLNLIPFGSAFADYEAEARSNCAEQQAKVKYYTKVELEIDIHNLTNDTHKTLKETSEEVEGDAESNNAQEVIEYYRKVVKNFRIDYEEIAADYKPLEKENIDKITDARLVKEEGRIAECHITYTIIYKSETKFNPIKEAVVEVEVPTAGTEITVKDAEQQCDDVCPGILGRKEQNPVPSIKIVGETKGSNFRVVNYFWLAENSLSSSLFEGTIEAGKDYYAGIVLQPLEKYIFTSEVNIVGNNDAQTVTSLQNTGEQLIFTVKVHVPADDEEEEQQPIYYFIGEANQTYQGEDLIFHSSGPLEKFIAATVDGDVLAEGTHTLADGSTILTLLSTYLDTLSAGEHTLALSYSDGGSLSATITILAAAGEPEDILPAQATTTASVTNPDTADSIAGYIISGIVSLIGLIGAIISLKK